MLTLTPPTTSKAKPKKRAKRCKGEDKCPDCQRASAMVERMNAIGGDKYDPMWIVERRSARCSQENQMSEVAARRLPRLTPEQRKEIHDRLAYREAHRPVRIETGPFQCGCAGHDPDSFGYQSIAIRALEECR